MLRCEKKRKLPTNEIEQAWKIYRNSFAGQESICAQNQICFTKKKFMLAIDDNDWIKFFLYLDQALIGFCLSTNNLKKAQVGYINPKFLEKKYPVYVGKIFYTPIICIQPEHQKTENAFQMLIDNLSTHIAEHNSMVFCDFSLNKNGHLPELIVQALNKSNGISGRRNNSFTIVDSQIYVVIKTE